MQGQAAQFYEMCVRFNFSSYFWILPFISFLLGYQSLKWLLYSPTITTPTVLGLHIHDAIKQLSGYQLNVRILKEKEDADLPEGTIISQSPEPEKKIKPHQSVFLVITRKPPRLKTPELYGLKLDKIQEIARDKSLRLKVYTLESNYPSETCFAQFPLPKEPMATDTISVYISSGNSSLRVFPNLKQKKLSDATQFLKTYELQPTIFHAVQQPEGHDCSSCVITDQRPLEGSLVDLKKPFSVQLTVSPA